MSQDPARLGAGSRASSARLAWNTVYSVASYLLYIPVALLVVRFTVHGIGLKAYGVWGALTAVIAARELLDLGITAPVIKYVAEYVALDRTDEVNQILSTAMVLYLAVGSACAVPMVLTGPWMLRHFLHVHGHDPVLLFLYLCLVAGIVVTLTFSVLPSLLMGVQRSDVQAKLNLALNFAGAAGTIVVVHLGWGVDGLALNWLITGVAMSVVSSWFVSKRLFPPLRLTPLLFSLAMLKRVLSFSMRVQVATVTLFLNSQVDRALIAYDLGRAPVGMYQLASRVAQSVSGISFALMATVLPAASDMAATGNWERLRQLYLRTTRYSAIVVFGLCAATATLARPLVTVWLGRGYDQVANSIVIVLVGYAVWLPSQATTSCLNGIGQPGVRMRADVTFLLLHVPLSILLIWQFGYYGTLAGTAIALSTTRVYVYVAGSRVLGMGAMKLLTASLLQPAIGAAIATLTVIELRLLVPSSALIGLAAQATAFGAAYVGYVIVLALDDRDRELARQSVAALRRRASARRTSRSV